MVTVVLDIFEEDRACFGVLRRALPRQYWQEWDTDAYDKQCLSKIERRSYPTYATTDGLCLRFVNPLDGSYPDPSCEVNDPWIRPCEEVPGCCDLGKPRDYPTCFPSTYEP